MNAPAVTPLRIPATVRLEEQHDQRLQRIMDRYHVTKQVAILWCIEACSDDVLLNYLNAQTVSDMAV